MKKFSKKQAILIALTLVLGLGLFGCGKGPVNTNNNQGQNTNLNANATTTIGEIDTSNWKTYRNEEYGFEFRYPKDWTAVDDMNNAIYLKRNAEKNNLEAAEIGFPLAINIQKTKFTSVKDLFNDEFVNREKKLKPEYTEIEIDNLKWLQYSDPLTIGGCDETYIFIKSMNFYKLDRHASTCDINDNYFSKIIYSFQFTK